MKMQFNKVIGTKVYTFEVEGQNLYDLVTQANKLGFRDIKKCGACQYEYLEFRSYLAQEKYKYTKIVCMNPECGASVTFGQRSDDPDTFYLRRNKNTKKIEWEKPPKEYKRSEKKGYDANLDQMKAIPPQQNEEPIFDENSIPF